MAKITRSSPAIAAPVKQAVLVDPNAFKFTGAGDGLREIGNVLTELGQRRKKEQKILHELSERKRDMQDRIGASNANAIMEKAELDMAEELINTPPEKRSEVREKWTALAKSNIGPLDLSTDSRALVQNKTDIWAQKQIDLGEIDDVELAAEEALLLTTDDWVKALVEGDEEEIITNEDALNKVLAIKMTKTEAIQYKKKMEDVAIKQMTDNAITEVRELAAGTPLATIKRIEEEQEVRKRGEPSDFPLVSNENLLSAKNLAKSTIISNGNAIQKEFDLAVGKAAASFTQGVVDGTLTEPGVWTEIIVAPQSKQKEVAAFRTTWAGIARGIIERNQKKIDGTNKKNREEAYNPELVAELKTEARKALSAKEVERVKMKAATALGKDNINDSDIETINIDAEKTFKLATDKAINDGESQFASIQLRGTSIESLAPWIQSQISALTMGRKKITSTTVTDLISTFQDVGKAKQWSVNQARQDVIAEIDALIEEKKRPTVDGVRLLYIQAQKRWLIKTDTELVKEYKEWLIKKP